MSEHPGPEFAPPPPIAALPNFTLDVNSSVIYNLYGDNVIITSTYNVLIGAVIMT